MTTSTVAPTATNAALAAGAAHAADAEAFVVPPPLGSPELRAMHRPVGIRFPDFERHVPGGLSASSMNSYLRCARQWMYERIYRFPTLPHVNATAGTHAHRVLERVMDEAPQDRTLERAVQINEQIVTKLDDALAMLLEVEDTEARRELAHELGRKDEDIRHVGEVIHVLDDRDIFNARTADALRGYFEMSKDPAAIDLVGTEHDLSTTLETPSGPMPVRAIIDRVDRLPEKFGGGLMVVDYKTGKPVDDRWDDGAYRRQILIYAAMVEAVHGELPTHGVLLYVNARQVKKVAITREAVDAVVAQAGHVFAEMVNRAESDDFDANVSTLCGWCPFVDLCDEGETHVRAQAAIGDGPGGLRAHAPARLILDLTPDAND